MITDTTKLNAVIEYVKADLTKSQIAKKYNISTRSLGRYIEKYESQAVKYIVDNGEFEMKDATMTDTIDEITETQAAEASVDLENDDVQVDEFQAESVTADDEVTVTDQTPTALNPMTFMVQQGTVSGQTQQPAPKKSKAGRKKESDGPSIKQTVIDLMMRYKDDGKFTKEYREDCLAEICQATGMDRKAASKYYAGYKKFVLAS